MRASSNWSLAIVLGASLAATISCQSVQKPSAFLPPAQAQAPALAAVSNPPQQKTADSKLQNLKRKRPAPQALQVDPAGDLIAQVEKYYQEGQENYRAGHLEAAKQNFDSAFNLLLGGGIDLGSDERLQHELDRILDGVNGLELLALQQGDGFTEQKSEPAPIDEANEVTFPVDPSIKAKAEAEIQVHTFRPAAHADRSGRRLHQLLFHARPRHPGARPGPLRALSGDDRGIFREEGVPQELIYLAQAESGFHPLALSRVGARGMWQFMASRARGYGLQHNWWVDERQDPEKATRAAARHLKDLYNQFGDWYLAMAAYNSGPGTVQSAVKRTGYADFWELYRRNVLPKETRNYVPIILAVTIMAKNPEQYGLEKIVATKPLPYDAVKIDYPIDLRLVAECIDASTADAAGPESQPAAPDHSEGPGI